MKRILFFILILFCLLPVSGCVQKNCEDENVQSFFTGEIKESGEDYIILSVKLTTAETAEYLKALMFMFQEIM